MPAGFTPCHLLCRHGMATQMCGIIGLFTHEVHSEPQRLSEALWCSHTMLRPSFAMTQTAPGPHLCLQAILQCPSPQSAVTLTAVEASGPLFTLRPL